MENIFSASKPFLSFSKILGLFPLSFDGPERKGFLKIKLSGLVFSCFSCLFLVYITWANLTFMKLLTNESVILVNAWNIAKTIETLVLFYLFGYQAFKCKNVLKFLRIVEGIDESVRQYALLILSFKLGLFVYFQFKVCNIEVDHKTHKKFAFLTIFIVITTTAIISSFMPLLYIFNGHADATTVDANLKIIFTHLIKLVYNAQFILAILVIQTRFKALNHNLETSNCIKNAKNSVELLNNLKIVKVYHKLCDGIEVINETFTCHFIFMFAYSLVRVLDF